MQKYNVMVYNTDDLTFLYECVQQLSQFKDDIECLYIQEIPDQVKLATLLERTFDSFPQLKKNTRIIPYNKDPLLVQCEGLRILMDSHDLWTYVGWSKMKNLVRHYKDYQSFKIRSTFWFWNPYYYCLASTGPSVVRPDVDVNKIMVDPKYTLAIPPTNESCCNSYMFVDPTATLNRVKQFDHGIWRDCGSEWFKNIYMQFDGTLIGANQLYDRNFGTLHPWGRNAPGWLGDEFKPMMTDNPTHPQAIRQYFDKRNFDTSKVTYV